MIYQESLTYSTRGHKDMHNITDQVNAIILRSQITTGVAVVCNLGSTAVIGCIEFEPGLKRDLPELLDRLIPPSRDYGHELAWHDGNGHSHLQATLLGPSLSLPVTAGTLAVGTWQQVFLLECDVRARQRSVVVTVFGE